MPLRPGTGHLDAEMDIFGEDLKMFKGCWNNFGKSGKLSMSGKFLRTVSSFHFSPPSLKANLQFCIFVHFLLFSSTNLSYN